VDVISESKSVLPFIDNKNTSDRNIEMQLCSLSGFVVDEPTTKEIILSITMVQAKEAHKKKEVVNYGILTISEVSQECIHVNRCYQFQ
jgi:hypothetical protein